MEAYLSLLASRRDGLHSFEHSSHRPRPRQHPQQDLRRFCLRRHSLCPDLRSSDSSFSFFAAISSLGVDDLMGDLAEMPGDLGLCSLESL